MQTQKSEIEAAGPAQQTISVVVEPLEAEVSENGALHSTVLKALNGAIKLRRRYQKLLYPSIGVIAASLAGLAYGSVSIPSFSSSLPMKALMTLLISGYGGTIAALTGGRIGVQRELRTLTDAPLPEDLPVLLDAMREESGISGIASVGLMRLLPEVTAENISLTPEQWKRLFDCIERACTRQRIGSYSPDLAVELLNAVGRIGTAAQIQQLANFVSKLDNALPEHKAAIMEAVQTNVECLRTGSKLAGRVNETPAVPAANAAILTDAELQKYVNSIQGTNSSTRRYLLRTIVLAVAGLGVAGIHLGMVKSGAGASPLLVLLLVGILGTMVASAFRGAYASQKLLHSLTRYQDLRLIAPLMDIAATALNSGSTAAIVLTPLLKKIGTADAALLPPATRNQLNTALYNHYANQEFVLAAFSALEKVGDEASLEAVRKAADRAGGRPRGEALREAAETCLAALSLRAEEHKQSQTLLRASSPNAGGSNSLLRPTEGVATEDQRELLRAGSSETEG